MKLQYKSIKRKRFCFVLSVVLFMVLFLSTEGSASSAITPQQARTESIGSVVTVSGYAASPCSKDGTGFGDEFYLYGGTNGICVSLSKDENISLYENLEVTGTLIISGGELKLESSEITKKGTASSRLFKRLSVYEAGNYTKWGGTFVRLIGTATDMKSSDGIISSFTLTDDSASIKVIIEKDVLSLSEGAYGKKELTELLAYRREVVVDGFVAALNGETVIRIKDCDDIDVKYHACSFGTAVTEKEPSCGVSGLSVRTCICGKREETVLPALEHKMKEKTEQKPTCTEEGIQVKYCSGCSFREETAIPKTEHSYKEKTEKKATCAEEGIYVKYCANCSFREETAIPKTEHSYKEKTEKKATCAEEGIHVKYCSGCSFREETAIPKTEHSYKEKTETEPTCFSEGLLVKICSGCSERTETALPKLSHSYESKTEKATFSKNGAEYDQCKSCGDKINETVIPAVTVWQLKDDSFVYDGNTHCPEISLKDEKGNTVESFTLTASDSSQIGKHTVTIKLNSKYSGQKSLSYKIVPEDVSAVSFSVSGKTAKLSFSASEKADGYRIYYKNGSSLSSLKTTTDTDCTVTLPDYNSKYSLIIKAYTETSDGNMWSEGTMFSLTTAPEKVTGITAESDYCSVRLTWNSAEGAVGYRVYMKKSNGSFKKLITTQETRYEITGLSSEKEYTFSVKPYSKADSKTLWGEAVRKTVTTPSGKTASFSADESYYSVKLSWRSVKNADGYRLYKYNSKKGKYTIVTNTADNSYTAEDLNSGTTYRFAVRPFIKKNGKTYLGESEYLTVTTKLRKPVLVAVLKSGKINSLSWNKINGADGYEIYYCYEKSGKYKKLKTTSARSFTHTKVSKTYYYKVRAYKTVDGKKLYSSFSAVKKVAR